MTQDPSEKTIESVKIADLLKDSPQSEPPTKFRASVCVIIGAAITAALFFYGARIILRYIIGKEATTFTGIYGDGLDAWLFVTWLPLCIFFGYSLGEAFLKKSFYYLKYQLWPPDTKICFWIQITSLLINIIIYKYYAERPMIEPCADIGTLLAFFLCVRILARYRIRKQP